MVALANGIVYEDIDQPLSLNPNLSSDFYTIVTTPYPYGVSVNDYFNSAVTRTLNVDALERQIEGTIQGIYFDDYYNRIHVKPQSFALGNLISAVTQTVQVWNSYLTPKLLQSIDGIPATAGVTVTSPEPEPSFFAATEERDYVFNIAKNGDAIIDFVAVFNFVEANDPTVSFTGRRLVIVPFKPLTDMKEKLNWLTDIIQAYDSEQRMALRVAPRQEFEYEYYLNENDFSKLKAIAFSWGFRIYAIPVWHEKTYVGTVLSGATQILFNTANADYRNNGLIAVIGPNDDIEGVEIDQVFSNRVTLKLPFPRNMSECYVAPLRFARTLNGLNFVREAPNHAFASMNFTVTDNVDLSATGTFTNYLGLNVLLDCIVLITPINERLAHSTDVFDNGSGAIEVDTNINYIGRTATMTLVSYSKAELWRNRQFLHRMKGKRGAFWRPTFNADMTLVSTIGPTSSTMTIKSIGYALYYGITDFMVEMIDGTRYFNRAVGGAESGANDVVTLNASFGVTIVPANVKRISFMYKCRIDSDTIEIRHLEKEICHTAVQIREIPA
jgi:hypothetical protein